MAQKPSAGHHYVAQAILSNFCFVGQSTYYIKRSKLEGGVEKRNKNSIFKRRHYNSLTLNSGKKDDSLEKFFAYQFDNYIPDFVEIFRAALKSSSVDFPSDELRFRFIQFFFNHMKRTPDFIEPIVQEVTEATFHAGFLAEYEKEHGPLTDKDKALYEDKERLSDIVSNSRVQNISRQSLPVLETLFRMDICVATPARSTKQFIVGSNPVVRFENFPRQPLGQIGVELWTTLAPDIAVGFGNLAEKKNAVQLDDTSVRKINSELTRRSSAIAGRSEKLVLSLARANW